MTTSPMRSYQEMSLSPAENQASSVQHSIESDNDDAGDLIHHHKSGEAGLAHDSLGAIYIA